VRASIRTFLFLNALALGAAAALAVVALGLPLAARHALGHAGVFVVAAAAGLAVVALAVVLLFRGVARPIDRLLAAAARLGPGSASSGLPILGEPGGLALSRAAVACDRLALAFEESAAGSPRRSGS
jgi:two-component system, NtrC family, sensor kinase